MSIGKERVRTLGLMLIALTAFASARVDGTVAASAAHRPDAWIKLCGPTNTCVNQPWHPWRGDNAYTNGRRQTILGGVEEGNLIRFWILLQNDGTGSDRLRVKGCSGNASFPVKAVNRGAWRYYTRKAVVTGGFKSGGLAFAFPSTAPDRIVVITVTFLAATRTHGVTYSCPITVRSAKQPKLKDTVVARMVTI